MRHETPTSDVARKVADEVLVGEVGVEAFVVISSVDLEIAKERRKYRDHSRRQLARRLKSIPDARTFCAAIEDGGLAAARAVADGAQSEPRSVWWSESRAEFEEILAGICERLRRSARPHDAYDFGVCGPLAWVVLWRD